MAKKKKKGSGVRVLLSIFCILLALALGGAALGYFQLNALLNKIQRPDASEPTLSDAQIQEIENETEPEDVDFTGEVVDPDDIERPEAPDEIIGEEEHIINLLLIGQDRRPGQGRQRSDAMILCSINKEKKSLTMTSFLRDTYVQIPEWNGKTYLDNRLNVNYAFGGMGMLDACLELNFGVKVEHNIEVDFSGFEDVIDLMGGVDIELTGAEAWYLGDGLVQGMNHLNGEQALNYSRIRKLDSDFARTDRQRKVLTALINKAKGLSLEDLLKLAEGVIPMITTDMENGEIIGLVMDLFPLLKDLQITTQHIPAEGTYRGASVRGMSVLIPDLEANRELLKETIQ